MLAGVCAAAALARTVNGVVFDEAEDRLLSVEEAIAVARKNLAILPKDAVRLPGTRPDDIKRYLKPLLDMRPDLVLIGRMLIVRPVRHILRGAFFDRTSDKYAFRIQRYLKPLYDAQAGPGYGDNIHDRLWKVYEPYFQPLLLDSLVEDFFSDLGQVTTFEELARGPLAQDRAWRPPHTARITTLVLAGRSDEAAAVVDQIEQAKGDNPYWRSWAKEQRRLIDRDINELCAELHAVEAEIAKELKLGDVWEPSPFPVEVRKTEGAVRGAEPLFRTTPWINRLPDLVEEPPTRPGEVRFAQQWLRREGNMKLIAALTSEKAEARHRMHQDYVLAARPSEGQTLVMEHHTGWSLLDPVQPRNPDYVPMTKFILWIDGGMGVIRAEFGEPYDQRGIVRIESVAVRRHSDMGTVWNGSNYFRQHEIIVFDSRTDNGLRTRRPIEEVDMSLLKRPMPLFGEYADLVRRTHAYLEREGFGAFS